jgi:uncharacterized protein
MTRITLVALALATVLAAPASANGIQTIDCAVDLNTAAERTICKSQRLQVLDARITEVYADLMTSRRVPFDAKSRVRESQYQFLERRNACGADRACLEDVMGRRLSRIHAYI